MTTFREWFKDNLSDYAGDIASHGADCGFPHISYISDCVKVFDQFADEIWDMADTDAEDMGCRNVAELIAGFKRADMLRDYDCFRNLMLWYACERVAREIVDAEEGEDQYGRRFPDRSPGAAAGLAGRVDARRPLR